MQPALQRPPSSLPSGLLVWLTLPLKVKAVVHSQVVWWLGCAPGRHSWGEMSVQNYFQNDLEMLGFHFWSKRAMGDTCFCPGEDGDPSAGKGGGFEVEKSYVLWVATQNQISVPLCHWAFLACTPKRWGSVRAFASSYLYSYQKWLQHSSLWN